MAVDDCSLSLLDRAHVKKGLVMLRLAGRGATFFRFQHVPFVEAQRALQGRYSHFVVVKCLLKAGRGRGEDFEQQKNDCMFVFPLTNVLHLQLFM